MMTALQALDEDRALLEKACSECHTLDVITGSAGPDRGRYLFGLAEWVSTDFSGSADRGCL
jgi:hypothetical protein